MQDFLSEVLYSLAIAGALIAEGLIEFRYFYKTAQNERSFSEAFQGMMVVVQIGTLCLAVPPLWWFRIPWILAIGLWTWASTLAGGIVVYIMIQDYDGEHQEEIERIRAMGSELYDEILKLRGKKKPSDTPVTIESLRRERAKHTNATLGGVGKPVTIEFGGVASNGNMVLRVNFWGISKGYTYLCAPGAMDAIWKYHDYIIQGNKGNQKSSMIESFLKIIKTGNFIEMRQFNGRDVLAESYQVPSEDEGYTDYVMKYYYFSDVDKSWLSGFMGLTIHEAVGDTIEQSLSEIPLIHNVTELFQSARKL